MVTSKKSLRTPVLINFTETLEESRICYFTNRQNKIFLPWHFGRFYYFKIYFALHTQNNCHDKRCSMILWSINHCKENKIKLVKNLLLFRKKENNRNTLQSFIQCSLRIVGKDISKRQPINYVSFSVIFSAFNEPGNRCVFSRKGCHLCRSDCLNTFMYFFT